MSAIRRHKSFCDRTTYSRLNDNVPTIVARRLTILQQENRTTAQLAYCPKFTRATHTAQIEFIVSQHHSTAPWGKALSPPLRISGLEFFLIRGSRANDSIAVRDLATR